MSESPAPSDLLTRAECAAFLRARGVKCSASTLANWATLLEGPPYTRAGFRTLYDPREVIVWTEQRSQRSAPRKTRK